MVTINKKQIGYNRKNIKIKNLISKTDSLDKYTN